MSCLREAGQVGAGVGDIWISWYLKSEGKPASGFYNNKTFMWSYFRVTINGLYNCYTLVHTHEREKREYMSSKEGGIWLTH